MGVLLRLKGISNDTDTILWGETCLHFPSHYDIMSVQNKLKNAGASCVRAGVSAACFKRLRCPGCILCRNLVWRGNRFRIRRNRNERIY